MYLHVLLECPYDALHGVYVLVVCRYDTPYRELNRGGGPLSYLCVAEMKNEGSGRPWLLGRHLLSSCSCHGSRSMI